MGKTYKKVDNKLVVTETFERESKGLTVEVLESKVAALQTDLDHYNNLLKEAKKLGL